MPFFILPGKSPFALTLATFRVIVHPPMPTVLFTVIYPAHVGGLLRWGCQGRLWRGLISAPRLWYFIEKEQMVTVLLSHTTGCFLLPVTFTQEEAKHTCQASSFAAKNVW